MKYLITGITGFAGPHLANLLISEGHEVYGLMRGSNGMETDIMDVVDPDVYLKIKFLYGNIEDQQAMNNIFKTHAFDGVFHLAAQSHPPTSLLYPLDTFRTNIMGTANIIDAIENYGHTPGDQPEVNPPLRGGQGGAVGPRLMFCSTSEVYGNSGKDGNLLLETDPLAPSNPYAVSKAASDLYMQERMTNGKINGFITRAFSHTGPRRGKNFSISSDAFQLATACVHASGKPEVLAVGNLDSVRCVIDVRDVVKAYYMLMLAEKSSGHIFNVCGESPVKMGYFTNELIKLSGLDIKTEVSEKYYRPIDIAYQHGDTTALKAITGWEPQIPISTTLEDLLNYWIAKIS